MASSAPNKTKVISRQGNNIPILPKFYLGNRKIKVVKADSNLLRGLKVQTLFTEDLIYESKPGDFLNSDESICIVNKRNLTSNITRTIVRSVARPNEELKTSDDIVNLIGQENYDLVFSALCSVFSLELKVRGILALLTGRKFSENSNQTEITTVKKYVDTVCQTDQNCMDILIKQHKRKRVRRQQLTPYVVKDDPVKSVKKIVIPPESFQEFQNDSAKTVDNDGGSTLPILSLHDENSNSSIGNMSSLSNITLPHLLENPDALLEKIQSCTETSSEQTSTVICQPTTLTMLDGSQVTIPVKPEDDLHIATSDILNSVSPEHRAKLKLLQAYYDWKYCMVRDEDGNLPLHIAVNNGDMELLRRQCLVLKLRQESVDVLAGTMTALQMSLYQKNAVATAVLLQSGADLLKTDAENRTCVHLAAEESSDHLTTIIKHCRDDPLSILRDNEEFWKPGIEALSKPDQACYLLDKIARLTDNQGYTPLMLASKLGIYENVATLINVAPKTVNFQMPNTGNTALYLAVSAACIDASNRGNLKKVGESYLKIVAKLVENGADPSQENHTGHSVNILLNEFNIADLSNVIASKMTAANCFSGKIDTQKSFEKVMLIKDKEGNIQVTDIKVENDKKSEKRVEKHQAFVIEKNCVDAIVDKHIKVENEKQKPLILENIRVDTKIDNQTLIVTKVENDESNFDKLEDKYRDNADLFKSMHKNKTRESIVIKDISRVRKGKVVEDVKPAKIMKIKPDIDSPSSSKND